MKNLIIAFVFLMVGCSKTDNDSNIICTSNCNTFCGRIKTVDNIGIPNIKLTLDYYESNELAAKRRIIGETTTDQNGYYNMSVFLKDDEIGENSQGYFSLTVDSDKISNVLSEQYLKPNAILCENTKPKVYYSRLERNLTFENDYIIPKKGNVSVKLNNYNPIAIGDYFKASIKYSYNFLNNNWSTIQPWDGIYVYSSDNQTILNAETILNGNIKVLISKQKNGVIEHFQQDFVLDNPNVFELEFEY